MKNIKFIKKIIVVILIFSQIMPVFSSEDNKNPVNLNDNIPQSLSDLRRFEIVTLGAMPFVTLDTMIVHSGVKYLKTGVFVNPMSPTNGYSEKEVKQIILTSLGISVGIGITDFIVNIIKRNKNKTKNDYQQDGIIINGIDKNQIEDNSKNQIIEENELKFINDNDNADEIVGFENIFRKEKEITKLYEEENLEIILGDS